MGTDDWPIVVVAVAGVALLWVLRHNGYLQSGVPDSLPGEQPLSAALSQRPSTLIRVYRGRQQQDAALRFEAEAATLARAGYYPTGQSWAHGQWGFRDFLAALLLAVILIGILIFIYMLIVKPEGTLTVVYSRQEEALTERSVDVDNPKLPNFAK